MVTRYTGGLSHLPGVEMSCGKNSKKNFSVHNIFCFLVNFIRCTGPMVTMVTRYTGGLSQLPVVDLSWRKNSKKPTVHNIFCFLVNFIRHTGPMVTRYTGGLSQLLLVEMSCEKILRNTIFLNVRIRISQFYSMSPFKTQTTIIHNLSTRA